MRDDEKVLQQEGEHRSSVPALENGNTARQFKNDQSSSKKNGTDENRTINPQVKFRVTRWTVGPRGNKGESLLWKDLVIESLDPASFALSGDELESRTFLSE
jgi:hypothetical protein